MAQYAKKTYDRIVFCDFDGTITEHDTFASMLSKFASARFAEVRELIRNRQISIRQGVRTLLESIPSKKYPEIIDHIRHEPIRAGFEELLYWLKSVNVPFIIISGGLQDFVTTRLEKFLDDIHAVHAPIVNLEHNMIEVISEYEKDPELMAKADVMAAYTWKEAVSIGNASSDINMSLAASVVFARDVLKDYLQNQKIPFRQWNDFFDIQRQLAQLWSSLEG
ncbi:MAG: HAD-IB family phosphatase [Desulfobacterales bacterium]|nr:HAD-IB family phosphatase [Desulfobacterales bacterium]